MYGHPIAHRWAAAHRTRRSAQKTLATALAAVWGRTVDAAAALLVAVTFCAIIGAVLFAVWVGSNPPHLHDLSAAVPAAVDPGCHP